MHEITAPKPTVAIIGAGWLGSAVAKALSDRGQRVLATTRSGTWRGTGEPPLGVHLERFDILRDGEAGLRRLLAEVDRAIFCFAPAKDTDRRKLYVEGASIITRACTEARLRRVVYTSSTSALDRSGGADGWVDEQTAEWPQNARGRIQREAEECIRTGLAHAGVPWTILRLAGLYGPQRELSRIYRITREAPTRTGDGLERTNLIHRDDAITAVLATLDRPPSETGLIHVCDDDHRTRRQVIAAIAAIEGLPGPAWEEEPSQPLARGKQVRNAKMKEILGVRLRHPSH